MTNPVEETIKHLGGNAAVAKATGYSAGAVALWVYRRKIPRRAWPDLLGAYPALTMDDLRAVEPAPKDDQRQGAAA